jgi:hypothetical protein
LVGDRLRCVQGVDSFNVVQPTFIDAAFVRRTLVDRDRCANQITERKKQEAPTEAGAPVLVVIFIVAAVRYCAAA